MPQYNNLQEEELKIRIAEQFFVAYDCGNRLGKIDFCVTQKQDTKHVIAGEACLAPTEGRETVSLLWAEAKRGVIADIYKPLVQLILTIGKARTFETFLPPPFLAAFDAEKIAFIPYKDILPFFSQNDFNWNVTPSDEKSREFSLLYDAVKATLDKTAYIFRYDVHEAELHEFIKQHLSESSELIQINKNNFVSIYQRWLAQVQPSIDVNWEGLKKRGLIDGDFFLADLLSNNNQSIKEALFVLLRDNRYIVDRKVDADGLFTASEVFFKDQQKAHAQFWSLYQRPPREEYWDYIIKRRDLLVPQDVRERKGSFFTPKIWVDLSQKYLADALGENWQDEYYVWDCAAGTGNLLNGLTNKYHIWASTLDQQDVDVMKDRIKNGANLLESHVFQFDFLNDEFTKLPQPLQDIINDPEKHKRLVVYINPPYVEGDARIGRQRRDVQVCRIHDLYADKMGKASAELYVQFLLRIYYELSNCIIGQFSTLKHLQAPNFNDFRANFQPKLLSGFLVPARTFDNVNGEFPIGFFIWDTKLKETFRGIALPLLDADGKAIGEKYCESYDGKKLISDWLKTYSTVTTNEAIGHLASVGNDFQNWNTIFLDNVERPRKKGGRHTLVGAQNLFVIAIYFAVRIVIKAEWHNDRDQFLYPSAAYMTDRLFQSDCLTFLLFSNYIRSQYGINHWIPFTEQEVNAKEAFESHFMTDFMRGRCASGASTKCEVLGTTQNEEEKQTQQRTGTLRDLAQEQSFIPTEPLVFSPEATAVFDAGRELWRYYHAQPNANPNASYYDIREYFQGRKSVPGRGNSATSDQNLRKRRMNSRSEDAEYNRLLGNLKAAMEALRLKIVPKVYEYGFLLS